MFLLWNIFLKILLNLHFRTFALFIVIPLWLLFMITSFFEGSILRMTLILYYFELRFYVQRIQLFFANIQKIKINTIQCCKSKWNFFNCNAKNYEKNYNKKLLNFLFFFYFKPNLFSTFVVLRKKHSLINLNNNNF